MGSARRQWLALLTYVILLAGLAASAVAMISNLSDGFAALDQSRASRSRAPTGSCSARREPNLGGSEVNRSKVKAARIQIESLSSALELFYLDNGRYPSSSEGLAALVPRPANSASWNGPYLKTACVPTDPRCRPYVYKSPGDRTPYEINSPEG
jgi:type II secretion system protein G